MNRNSAEIKFLLSKYTDGLSSAEEEARLFSLFATPDLEEEIKLALAAQLEQTAPDPHYDAIKWERVFNNIKKQAIPTRMLTLKRIAVAASVLLISAVALYTYKNSTPEKDLLYLSKHDIKPGSNQATLTLANGEKIDLNDADKGAIWEDKGIKASRIKSGELVYTTGERSSADTTRHNSLATPKGGQYQVHLPDGTTIWLNAATTLTYPVNFAALKTRRVELNGEAYFEVAKDSSRPFLVVSNKQTVKVLGTHFNVSSYRDDQNITTTLLEGKVQVNNSILRPNQQAILNEKGFRISQVDAENAIAWKKGYFSFNDERLENILLKISRWYNVQIVYEDESLKNKKFWGSITRFGQLSKVLHLLEVTNEVKFNIDRQTLLVKKP